jgi:hypothetical protein
VSEERLERDPTSLLRQIAGDKAPAQLRERLSEIGAVPSPGCGLTSADGLVWRVAFETTLPEGWYVDRVVAVGDGLLAISNQAGVTCPAGASPCPEPDMSPFLWYSSDGVSWTQVDSPSWRSAWHFGSVWGVAAGPAGVVAIGGRGDRIADSPGDQLPAHQTVVHSVDGVNWQLIDLPAAFDHAIFRDLVAFSGGFVIFGRDGERDPVSEVSPLPPPGVGKPAAWFSSDGLTWSAAAVEGSAVAGGELRAIAAGASGLFAEGVDQSSNIASGTPQGWYSPDGRTWRLLGQNWPPNASPWWTLTGDGTRMILFGVRSSTPADFSLGAWTSTDGISWTPIDFSGATTIPAGYCGAPAADETSHCWALVRAWVLGDGVIVLGTGIVPQELWFATAVTGS